MSTANVTRFKKKRIKSYSTSITIKHNYATKNKLAIRLQNLERGKL